MNLIEILKVIVIGIVEGFTEWLPISSTGHMILIDELIHPDMTPEFREVFMVVIQLGAMLAMLLLFFRRLNPFDRRKRPEQRRATWNLLGKIAAGCVPAGILGLILNRWIEEHLFTPYVVAAMLILYGILYIVIEERNRTKLPEITKVSRISYQTALYIGLFQCLALVPGTSRSGSTILGAMLLGLSRPAAAEFSFFMGIPIIAAASLLKLIRYGWSFSGAEYAYLFIGILTAFLVSVYSVSFFMNWIKKNDFKLFGYYRIALGIIVLLWFAINAIVS